MMKCSNCGSNNPEGSKYCTYCGRKFEPGEVYSDEDEEQRKSRLIPTGAIIAIICFFLPWIKFSCNHDIVRTASGYDLAKGREILWIVLISAVIILIANMYLRARRQRKRLANIVHFSSAAGLLVMLFTYVQFSQGEKSEFGTIRPEDIGLTIQLGAFGTVIGLVLSMIGAAMLPKTRDGTTEVPALLGIQGKRKCPKCGEQNPIHNKFCEACGSPLERP